MRIGIDGSRAFLKQRTGIEEYSYQVIKSLRDKLNDDQARLASTSGFRKSRRVILYVRKNQKIDFPLPNNWKVKEIKFFRFWTQVGLSFEMLLHKVDVLFIPAHTVPIIHPRNTTVTIHGLEYEFCPQAYSLWERFYMRWSIKNSCKWAEKIIAVSENTKKDLIKLYKVPENKIEVIYEGVEINNQETRSKDQENTKYQIPNTKYLLFIGRLEERKNVSGIIEAYKILKEKYNIPHGLVLAGSSGYGYEKIKFKIQSRLGGTKLEIIELGYISENKKWELLSGADVFMFPSLYEGFGLPILEAQSVGVPVVTSNLSSLPEVADGGALLVNPRNPFEIAEATYKIISDENIKKDLIQKGLENVKRFSWDKCAEDIAEIFKKTI